MSDDRDYETFRLGYVDGHHPTSRSEIDLLKSEFDEFVEKVKADAWDEGYAQREKDTPNRELIFDETPNPYRPEHRNNYPKVEMRTIKRDGVTVHQGRYVDDPESRWHDIAIQEEQ